MRTTFEFQKFKKFVEKKIESIYVNEPFGDWKQNIIHVEHNLSDLEKQLARKTRTDVLSLYRNMSSLGVPVNTFIFLYNVLFLHVLLVFYCHTFSLTKSVTLYGDVLSGASVMKP